ncbi:MAG: Glycosyl transferase, group 1 [Candidatus Jettenia ecosi]|uniref:Thymidylate kinase n=1 Tax=Candidatus Jettenia ecosi TaxID=2494326 RepID=A0A533QSC7_9BACT|nr:MAG: Glycosyl transferase, group 1 [Candidatus Jettenia ecosi]
MARQYLFICFIGIDGSGKSSQAQLLQKHLNASGIAAVYTWSRWEPYLLKPFIRRFKGSRTTPEAMASNISNLQKKKRRFLRNPIVLWLWLNIALFDYYFQAKRRVFGLMNKNTVVICDRYLFDFMVDQAVNMGKKAEGLKHIFRLVLTRLFPLPDLLFILDVEPEKGYQRKQDGTRLEYLMERHELYRYYRHLPNATLIDANNSFDMVAHQITKHTMTFLKEQGVING